jgi:hypothetical protein
MIGFLRRLFNREPDVVESFWRPENDSSPVGKVKVLARNKTSPKVVIPGDSVRVYVTYPDGSKEILSEASATTSFVYDEAVCFEGEFEGRKTLGGMVVEKAA